MDTNGEHMTREHTNVEVEITLYALLGTPSLGTIRVNNKIKELGAISLIDLGSTHNFLDLYVVMSLKLSMDTSNVLSMPRGYDHLEQRCVLSTHVRPLSLSFLRMMHNLGVSYDNESFLIMVQESLSIIGFS